MPVEKLRPESGGEVQRTNLATFHLPPELDLGFRLKLGEWESNHNSVRLRKGDASLWTGKDENKWLGWLTILDRQKTRLPELKAFATLVRDRKFSQVVILGMGGSSLCTEVLAKTFAPALGYPRLRILDSTNPDQIMALEQSIDLDRTLFVVSSKSGTTLEPNIFRDYFYGILQAKLGRTQAVAHFIAITDPGSELEKDAVRKGFLKVFHGDPSIGGRYSALSDFGMVPAVCLGMNLGAFFESASSMVEACNEPAAENPGVRLGLALGVLAQNGRNKVTLMTSPEISDFGAWLEQLLAESTGKDGKGLIPVAGEEMGPPEVYGVDRQFYYLRLKDGTNAKLDQSAESLIRGGYPLVKIDLDGGALSIGQEFFRWEFATAVAGSILGVNPFDQPDVEAAKVAANQLMTDFDVNGELPADRPFFQEGSLSFYLEEFNRSQSRSESSPHAPTASQILREHLAQINPGDYFALLAFFEMNPKTEAILATLRIRIRDQYKIATCVGFGPRFLHSTGQAYKGGPNTGVFLQLTSRPRKDLPIPGHRYSFGAVQAAQARGDFEVLVKRDRRILRIDLGTDTVTGLDRLLTLI